jgi:UDP-N-acetyl-D-glucosamine dehydrogenase
LKGVAMLSYGMISDKIMKKNFAIGVVGLGYVGLPLSLAFAERGFTVVGFDIDDLKIRMLNEGRSYFKHIPSDRIKAVTLKTFKPTFGFRDLSLCDVMIICVPTPLTQSRDPDLQFVIATAKEIANHLDENQLVVLESTSYPGTTREVVREILEKETGLIAGKDFYLGFSSEREDPGNRDFDTVKIPKVISGFSEDCLHYMDLVYSEVFKVVKASSLESAELSKVFENVYRCVNIALVNELKVLCHKMDIDVWEVIRLASTKPFGFQAFYPGPGLGGHCIPIDPFYLAWKAKQYGLSTKFIELAGEINSSMPFYVVEKIRSVLNDEAKPLNGSNILVVGVAYKADIDDIRESPAILILKLLEISGAEIFYHDPYIPKILPTRKWDLNLQSVPLLDSFFSETEFDCAVIVTDHKDVDYDFIMRNVPVIVDTRNAIKTIPADCRCEVHSA